MNNTARAEAEISTAPNRAGLVLCALILVAAVANLNLAVANVALPSIGAIMQSFFGALRAAGYAKAALTPERQ